MEIIKKIIPNFLKNTLKRIYSYVIFISDCQKFKDASKIKDRFKVNWKDRNPQLSDKTNNTSFDAHYIYHPAWAARILAETKPEKHIDISSILNFSTIVSAFFNIEFYDYRPANIKLDNFKTGKADLLSLPFSDNSVKSLSCMHTVEHIGLGRYGDPIDPEGDLKAMGEIKRVMAKNGNLLFVVPIGKQKIAFNAHRIYSFDQIINYFSDFELKEFSLIPDDVMAIGIINRASKEQSDIQNYGCGCFWFIKK
jgi:ubiquinone/menaquinone biosynthesis C-methylase UbiE